MRIPFVGRDKETKRILNALDRGRNVILDGQYGIGRTSLIRHVAKLGGDRRQFVFGDLSDTAGKACKEIYARLGLDKKRKRFKGQRYRIANRYPETQKGRLVVVLDNIGKLTRQKLNFVRFLVLEGNAQIIAIIESFLTEKERFLLKSTMIPAECMTLRRLDRESTYEIFYSFSQTRRPSWSEEHIELLTQLCRGYPLSIAEKIASDRKNHAEGKTW